MVVAVEARVARGVFTNTFNVAAAGNAWVLAVAVLLVPVCGPPVAFVVVFPGIVGASIITGKLRWYRSPSAIVAIVVEVCHPWV